MQEFWEIIGPSFRLPIQVQWYDELAEWCYPVSMLMIQREATEKILEPISFSRADKRWIYRHDLVRIAHRSECKNPEEIVEWLPVGKKFHVEQYKNSAFIEAYCASPFAVSRDPVIMDVIFASFCKFMLDWFINRECEVDFGFMRVVPLLLRKNWANAAAKHERTDLNLKKIDREHFLDPDVQSMIKRKIADYLVTDNVAAYDQANKVPRPTLEIIPGEAFYEASIKREKARRRKWGFAYWREFMERLKRQLPTVLEIYAEHLKEAKYPSCEINPCVVGRGENKRRGTALVGKGKTPPGAWGEDITLFSRHESKDGTMAVQCEDGGMPEMRNLQS